MIVTDNLEPIGRRLERVKAGDTVYYYPEGKPFASAVPVKVTECNGDGTYQVKGDKGPGGMLRHDHMYREPKKK